MRVLGGDRQLQNVADPIQMNEVDGVLLQDEGSQWCVQQVVVQLVHAHTGYVLQNGLDHPLCTHLVVWRIDHRNYSFVP